MLLRIPLIIFCAFLCVCSELAVASTVKAVRVWRAADHSRIVLDLDSPVQHNLVLTTNPQRIVLDIPRAVFKGSLANLMLEGTPIDAVHNSTMNKKDLRLVFDLKKKVVPKSFLLKKHGDSDDRLVIDLFDAPEVVAASSKITTAKSVESDPSTTAHSAPTLNTSITEKKIMASEPADIEALIADEKPAAKNSKSIATQTSTRPILIAIDAGHGGEDTGALGPNNMREKDVTLAIAKELAKVINAQPGYNARLTRSGDTFVILQKRRDLARDMKADLFISVHADSFTDASAYGASVFALSRKGATSEMARFLAQRENDSDLVGRVGGVSLEDKDAMLAGVLVDLSMTSTVNSSLQLGSNVLSAISAISPLHAKHVEQAGFVVLKSPDVPSILVETGFISNKTESKKLASPAYRALMAEAIFKGVKQYFAQHPAATADAKSP